MLKRGFTLAEIVVAIALLAIIVGIVFISFSDINDNNVLESDISSVISRLDEARSKTLASENDSQYGVHIDTDRVISFIGSSYNVSDPNNDTYAISNLVEIVNISLNGGGSDVVFNRLNGQTNQQGSFVIRLKDNINASTIISIFETGIIEIN